VPPHDLVLNGAGRLEAMSAGFIEMAGQLPSQSTAEAKSGRLFFTKSLLSSESLSTNSGRSSDMVNATGSCHFLALLDSCRPRTRKHRRQTVNLGGFRLADNRSRRISDLPNRF
jgi:hypothetical protein